MDEAPMIMLGGLAISGMSSPRFAENGTGSVATYTATGPDADRASWSLEGADVGDFRISSGGMLTFRSSPDYENPMDADMDNMYMVTVKASDGTYMDTHAVMVMVTNEDELGMLLGQDSVGYMENDTVAVGTYTADGPVAASWSLEGDDMGAFTIGGSSGELVFASPPDFEAQTDMGMDNMYQVTVKAEAGGEMDMITVTITVTNVEEPGMVTLWAGADALTMAPQVGDTITGAVMDPDGGVTVETWQWAKTKTPDMMESWMPITGATGAAYMVTADDTGYYLRVMATYTDAAGRAMVYSMPTLMVTMMTVPTFESETATREVAENTAAGMNIGDPVMGTDADGDTLIYTLGGTDAASFDIDAATGQLMTVAALDYETKDSYSVTVTASDSGGLSDSIDVTITVTDVDEAQVITGDAAPNYAENGTGPVATYTATDPESATITWSLEGDDAADFEISAGGMLTFVSPPDHENPADADRDNVYEVTVKASDGTIVDTLDVTTTVTNVDEGFEVSGTAAVDYAENGTAAVATYSATDPESATITWSLEGDDAADFEISAGGMLTFVSSPDHENPADADPDNVYEVTVKASDGTNEDTLDVTITVTNVDEGFEVSGTAAVDYTENGTAAVATYSATDPESATISWSLEGDDAADFEISAGGMLTFVSSPDHENPADADPDNVYEVTVKASTGTNEDTLDVTITVTNVDEGFEVSGTAAVDYAENGTAAVATYSATDPESATITWSLEGDDAADFEISAGGMLTFVSSPDHENPADADRDNVYEVTVKASDGTNEDTLDVTITVTDVDEDVTPADPLVDRYDENDNGEIERSEVFPAISDYLDGDAGAPTRADVFRLIELYLGD